jgi:4-hydroxybenzoate polyprenyltransferase
LQDGRAPSASLINLDEDPFLVNDLLQLLRPQQWYKNLVIVVAIFFSHSLWNRQDIWLTALGFVALCMISSSGYIVNDIVDKDCDRFHPEKRSRPIASGRVRIWQAAPLAVVLLLASLALAGYLSTPFLYSVLALFTISLLYSLYLKHYVFVDMIAIATNFVVRALSGVFLIAAEVSPWLILCVFFLALLLVAIKRKSDMLLLKRRSASYKDVLRHYTVERLDRFITIDAAIVIISYCLYSFLRRDVIWMITVPIVVCGVFRYLYVTEADPRVGRQPERIFADGGMLAIIVAWCVAVGTILYLV